MLASSNPEANGFFGDATAIVPDVDGDGAPDLVVGAPGETVDLMPAVGRAYVFSGATGALLWQLEPLNKEPGMDFGECVAGVPDLDGDGRGDILVGAPDADPGPLTPGDAGRAYVFSGATGAVLFEIASPFQETDGAFGDDVAGIQDVNGDGRGDLVIGAPEEDAGNIDSGRVYVFSGATGLLLRFTVSPNPNFGGQFGDAVASVPDVNGDLVADVVVGAPFENPVGAPTACGRGYILSGATGGVLRAVQSPGQDDNGGFGECVAGLPDVNADGFGDIVIGAPRENPGTSPSNAGRANVYSGATGALLHKLIPPVSQLNGEFGFAVAAAPDLNADGVPDVLVGAWRERQPGQPLTVPPLTRRAFEVGRVHAYSGATGLRISSYAPPVPTGFDRFGRALAALPLPGGVRLLVGARGEYPPGAPVGAGLSHLLVP